ncbi:MAG: DedA family protein [Proteobacteria bacterium]|nr:DedA family protein [Pseudomonadota bacterium]
MSEYIDIINHWVLLNQNHAWWVIFLIAFVESMVILGILVPGLPFMLMLGGLIATQVLNPWLVIFWCVVGAVVGDGLSFWIGQRYKYHVLQLWPLNKHPEWVTRGEDFFTRWGGVSILIGRFFGPLRATVPVLAGILGMHRVKFTLWNILSAMIWAPAYLAPGFALGWLADQSEQGAWIAITIVIIGIISYWLWGRFKRVNNKDDATP